jgi:diguanylate cyclase (GGDEF)-like protein/PAS domain S-box-containing protein
MDYQEFQLPKREKVSPGSSLESRKARARLDQFARCSPGVIFCCEPFAGWRATFVGGGVKAILGYEAETFLKNPLLWLDLVHPDDRSELADRLKSLTGRDSDVHEYRVRHRDGEYRWIRDEMSVFRDDDGRPREFIGYWLDITEYKALEAQLIFDAFHDTLTKLPNRSLFLDRLQVAFARLKRHPDHVFAVLFIDLDRFKNINDSLGHEAGDALLVALAERLQKCLRFGDTVARWGGDEFIIILEDINGLEDARATAERLLKVINAPFRVMGRKKFITASVGISLAGRGTESAEQLVRDSDIAMYRAKKTGGGRGVVFRESMRQQTLTMHDLETDLWQAVERKELGLCFQPVLRTQGAGLFALEALLRWNHPERGLIMPDQFIPIAEETGLIIPIGNWVIQEACRRLSEWRETAPAAAGAVVSINISGRQFLPSLAKDLKLVIKETGVDPGSIIFEITESAVVEDFKRAALVVKQLKKMAVQVYIDDFGSGYSSMNYLRRLPVDGLKIDRSFIESMAPGSHSYEIVRSIIGLGRKLGLTVVAEGVETESQLESLRALGCPLVQGFFFERPLDPEALEAFLTRQARRARGKRPK